MEHTSIDVLPAAGEYDSTLDALLSVWPRTGENHDQGNFVVMHQPICAVMNAYACCCNPTLIAPRQSRLVS